MKIRSWFSGAALAAFSMVATSAPRADAFCGFYVAPSDGPLYNDATQVALMREGTRTVISMSNNYRGPLADFAMVVPVPVVLQKESVKTLPRGAFEKLESLSAPRLVEYWEQDPCFVPKYDDVDKKGAMPSTAAAADAPGAGGRGYGVKIEAQFTVGEYDIVILSAKDSDGLERWLGDNKYKIPKGSAEALAPYVKEQMKFFVAKVDATKVTRDETGAVVLSPLRFHYEETTFKLPVRLGLLNAPLPGSGGGAAKQDLIVYVLGENKRYEVANYPNAFIPTNLDVTNETRKAFGSFYATLFDATIAKAGGRAVVTEYSWQSSSCDPCPTPPLEDADIATLGGDVLFGMGAPPPPPGAGAGDAGVAPLPGALPPPLPGGGRMGGGFYGGSSHPVVLTRLHARYDASTLTEDLVFKAADPVVGGREFVVDDKGSLEKGAQSSPGGNNFQARYAIRHPWDGPVLCAKPRRGIWGGPPAGKEGTTAPAPAKGLAAAPRGGVALASYVSRGLDDVGEYDKALGLKPPAPKAAAAAAAAKAKAKAEDVPPPKGKCGCSTPGSDGGLGAGAFGAIGLAALGLARTVARSKARRAGRGGGK
jgi:hypothetical protein